MGTVYLVHDTQLGRQVALKVPHFRSEEDGARPEHRELDRFYREVRVAATLDHPNLCPVYDAGEIDGIPYLVMAYIKGRPLSRYIKRSRPMSQRRAAAIVRKLALALEEAHSQGVVHRDLKPSNIMVNARRDLVIMDFGLVWRIGAQDERLTRVGLVLGTPAYMSPEQICGRAEGLGPCCDIYSLGVILYELLTGCVPFEGPEAFVLGQIVFAEPAPPSKHRPDVDPLIEAICLRAMAKKVEDRYASMRELAMALERFLRSSSNTFRPAPETARAEEIAAVMGTATERLTGRAWPNQPSHPSRHRLAEASSAERTIPPSELMPLWLALHQWIEIIEHFVLQRSRRFVNHRNYDRLYRMLVETCRMRASTTEGATRQFYQRLEDLVVPWMTPRAMECADREILGSLLCYCREAEQALRDRTKPLPDLGKRRGVGDKLAGSGRGDLDVCGGWPVDRVGFALVLILSTTGVWRRAERGRAGSRIQVVHEPEDIQECTKLFVRDAGLAKIDGKLLNAKSSGFQVAGGGVSLVTSRAGARRAGARSSRLGVQAIGGLVRRSEPVFDLDHAVLEVSPR